MNSQFLFWFLLCYRIDDGGGTL